MVRVVLMNPKFEGNVGFIARLMANFGYNDLALVDPVSIEDEARMYASQAEYILDNACIYNSFEEAVQNIDTKIATTGIPGVTDSNHIRMPYYTPKELKNQLDGYGGNIALIFGKEDHGLPNKIIKKCEIVTSIPTSDRYPVLNLSHAVAILLYELSDIQKTDISVPNQKEMKLIHNRINQILQLINHPKHKKQKTKLMMKRILGRANLTKREAYTLLGILKNTIKKIKQNKTK
ncbi:tRNA C32U32 (ribose-2'-O)-methylase TrmJ [Methanonatronarchaeum thermophilum]|uniref:tRNA C32U32 (Ribose-2'-O)-methylase TrmJ n=1 Tax=Methanonatronarchaeum thermophilum TaxID=1927129 RepID=A0A1Y3GDK2_9EURY|nr:RNA methyltransferase [Methanonatronarchaeum thermophilum]OUJ19518.1 tRNA C32U32 (ribose-2'-O)-methylase TrmJ [Methanonatronarchaeum thermophilum]